MFVELRKVDDDSPSLERHIAAREERIKKQRSCRSPETRRARNKKRSVRARHAPNDASTCGGSASATTRSRLARAGNAYLPSRSDFPSCVDGATHAAGTMFPTPVLDEGAGLTPVKNSGGPHVVALVTVFSSTGVLRSLLHREAAQRGEQEKPGPNVDEHEYRE